MVEQLSESDREALEDIEFPTHLPEDQCVQAVLEVREYILKNGKATKEEIWADVVLDTSHSSSGREVCRHWGYVPKFRDNWWEFVILPGLKRIHDVEPGTNEELSWKPIDDSENAKH